MHCCCLFRIQLQLHVRYNLELVTLRLVTPGSGSILFTVTLERQKNIIHYTGDFVIKGLIISVFCRKFDSVP